MGSKDCTIYHYTMVLYYTLSKTCFLSQTINIVVNWKGLLNYFNEQLVTWHRMGSRLYHLEKFAVTYLICVCFCAARQSLYGAILGPRSPFVVSKMREQKI